MKWIAVPLLILAVAVHADDRDAKLWELILDPATPRDVRRKAVADARFERFDADKDGILSRDEFIHQGVIPKQ